MMSLLAIFLIQFVMAILLALAGVSKLRERATTKGVLFSFGVPKRMTASAAWILPIAELSVALGLMIPSLAWPAAAGAATLFSTFTFFVAVNLARGRNLNCNCFGGSKATPISLKTLWRNLTLTALAVLVTWTGPAISPMGWWGHFATLLAWMCLAFSAGAFVVTASAIAVTRILKTSGHKRRIVPRQDGHAAFNHRVKIAIKPASLGLPVGTIAPDFDLPNCNGERVTLRNILAFKRRTLIVFFGLGCPSCEALALEAQALVSDPRLGFIIVLVREGGVVPCPTSTAVLLQTRREVADIYKVWGTPEAVWIDPNGTIASPLIKGIGAIRRALMEGGPSRSAICQSEGGAPTTERLNGLTIGARPPAVTLVDQFVREFTLEKFKGRELLIIFLSSNCPYCHTLLEMLKSWEPSSPPWAPAVMLICTDKNDSTATTAGLSAQIGFDPEAILAKAFAIRGTPSGVLLDQNGEVSSELADGPNAIMHMANGVEPVAADS